MRLGTSYSLEEVIKKVPLDFVNMYLQPKISGGGVEVVDRRRKLMTNA
jgi:hypothetical protein